MLSDLGVLALSFYRLPLGKSLLARDQLTFLFLASHFASYGEIWSHLKCHSFLREILLPDDYEIWDLEYFWMVSPKVSLFFEGNSASR